jgi:acetyl-CoA C-acetyltransferase
MRENVKETWILAGKRTPIGKFLGDFTQHPAPELAAACVQATLQRSNCPTENIGELIFGNVLSAGIGQAPARQVVHAAKLPNNIGAASVNKVCGSGLYAVMLAARAIQAGCYDAAIAGGMESMSQAPHLLRNARQGWKYGSEQLFDTIEYDGLTCAQGKSLMGNYAERLAEQLGITRSEQDQWAHQSHQKALAAQSQGSFGEEIVPIQLTNGSFVHKDAGPRPDSTPEKLARLKPAFAPKGTVTPGNASSLSDGAASLLVVNETLLSSLPPQDSFRIITTSVASIAPADLFLAPVFAIQKALYQSRYSLEDIDLIEINEAFAAQTIACIRELKADPQRVNIHGGAIALGHPIGCSGARILVTLMHALSHHRLQRGIAALCLGGGEAVAILIERSA